jgi:hypothetical protein
MSSAQDVLAGKVTGTGPRPGGTGRAERGVWTLGELAHDTPLWESVGLVAESAAKGVDEDAVRFPVNMTIVRYD